MRGSKRKLRDGVWEVRVYLGRDQAGQVKHLSRPAHGSAREADAVLHELIAKHADAEMDGLGMTLGQRLDRWLAECERLDQSTLGAGTTGVDPPGPNTHTADGPAAGCRSTPISL